MSDARDLLALQAAALFVLDADGRIVRLNSPDTVAPPSLYMSGCADGWIVRLRADVSAGVAAQVLALVAREPPVIAAGQWPKFTDDYRRLLGVDAPLSPRQKGPIHLLPHATRSASVARIVCQHTPEGDALWARLQRDGMPAAMVADGFTDLSHFWEPWCVAMVGDEIGAIAFAARLSPQAAEIGVHTMKPFRGRRLAAAVTAGWSTMPILRQRTLFYSTLGDNLASQRVIAQLDLPFLGQSFRL